MPQARSATPRLLRLLALTAATAITVAFFLPWIDLSTVLIPSLNQALPDGISGAELALIPMRYEETVLAWLAQAEEQAGFVWRSALDNALQAALDAAPAVTNAQGALALFIVPVLGVLAALMLVIGRGWWEWPLFLAAILPLALGIAAVAMQWGGDVAMALSGPDERTGVMVEMATTMISTAGIRFGLGAWIGGVAGLLAIICWGTQITRRLVRLFGGRRNASGMPREDQG